MLQRRKRTTVLVVLLAMCFIAVAMQTLSVSTSVRRSGRRGQKHGVLRRDSAAASEPNAAAHVPLSASDRKERRQRSQKNRRAGGKGGAGKGKRSGRRKKNGAGRQKSENVAARSGETATAEMTCGSARLRRLDVSKQQHQRLTQNVRSPDELVPQNVWRRIVNTPGDRLDVLHLTIVPFVSAMQWKHDVYGTVAQLNGVGFGKLTSLLAQTVDATSGERLFVVDTFATSPDAGGASSGSGRQGMSLSGLISHHEVFAAHVRDNSGFDEHSADPSRRLYIHRGSLDDLRHNATVASFVEELSQFRFVAVGNDSSESSALSAASRPGSLTALETAVCFLRDGGLIVVDYDVESASAGGDRSDDQRRQIPLVEAFFSRHGRSIIAPLLSAGNKLYLTTTNFRRKYIDYINDAGDWLTLHIGKTPVRSTAAGLSGFEFLTLQ